MTVTPVKQIVEQNRANYEKTNEELQNAWQQLQQNGRSMEDAWGQISPQSELERHDAIDRRLANDDNDDAFLAEEDIPELQDDENVEPARSLISVELTTDSVKPLLRSMNENQQKVFYHIRNWCLESAQGKNPDPFFLHVGGGAGTGKSHLIRCIYYEASKILKNRENPNETKVLLTAPTGTAAFSVNGYTINSALKLGKKVTSTYEPLSSKTLDSLQNQLSGLQILIIDEISMVARKVFSYIHGRLKQIKRFPSTDRTAYFGKVCILAVGDFYQLPPVKLTLVTK